MGTIDDIFGDPTRLIAFCALLVSIVTVIANLVGMYFQKRHFKLTVRPLGSVGFVDSNKGFSLNLNNNGVGPMIIRAISTSNIQGIMKGDPREWFDSEERYGIHHWGNLEGTALSPGQSISIFGYALQPNRSLNDQNNKKNRLISGLKELTIHVTYTDLYGEIQPCLIKPLNDYIRCESIQMNY